MKAFLGISIKPVQDVSKNPLDWWARHANKYPLIAEMACSALALPASSAPSERVFSQAGLLMSDKCSWIAPERLETIMFLKGSWEAADGFTLGSSSNK